MSFVSNFFAFYVLAVKVDVRFERTSKEDFYEDERQEELFLLFRDTLKGLQRKFKSDAWNHMYVWDAYKLCRVRV